MTTQSLAIPAVGMPRGTAVTAVARTPKAADGTEHLNGNLSSLTALALAAVSAVVVTALFYLAA